MKVSEIIRSVMGDRIAQGDHHGKLCKRTEHHKKQKIEKYQLLGFNLNGVDGQVHTCDHEYYKNYSNDIKDLQRQLCDALRSAGYDVERLILVPTENDNHWSLSFTVITCDQDQDK